MASKAIFPSICIVTADCLSPGGRGDPNATYLVQIADRRYTLQRLPAVGAAYNQLDLSTGAYITSTENQGLPWTWTLLVGSLWGQISQLGNFPGLPFTPDGVPQDFEFWDVDPLTALGVLLKRLGCALVYNPIADTFGIVQVEAADPVNAASLVRWDQYRHWDGDPLRSVRANLPTSVEVLFRVLPYVRGQAFLDGSPYYPIAVADPTGNAATGQEPGSVQILHDDEYALLSSGGSDITNLA